MPTVMPQGEEIRQADRRSPETAGRSMPEIRPYALGSRVSVQMGEGTRPIVYGL